MPIKLDGYEKRLSAAVGLYWRTLASQGAKQKAGAGSDADRGGRSAVTGGKQMAGFCQLVGDLLVANGVAGAHLYLDKELELPGFFRPTKKWDMLVVRDKQLIAALEFKSQRGPSFGNNFNNRTEEAIGTAHDLWTAFREGAFGTHAAPWLGWVMLLDDCPASKSPVAVAEPHFPVFPEFVGASYAKRYELLLRKLTREKLYNSAAFLMATEKDGLAGRFSEPAADLGMRGFLAGLIGHAMAVVAGGK